MFRSLWSGIGGRATLQRSVTIGGEPSSSSPTWRYFLFTLPNQNVVVISNSRVHPSFSSFSTSTASSDGGGNVTSSSDSSFVVSYLVNSCGLTQTQAIAASGKLKFRTKSQPDSVLTLLKTYGFTETHISKLITKDPSVLSSKPDKTLKPKFEFLKSKGLSEIDLSNFLSNNPRILKQSFNKERVPSSDILKTIVHSDQNVIRMIKRSSWILSPCHVKKVVPNVEILRNAGVPEANIVKSLILTPRAFILDFNRLKEIVEKAKEMGFNHLEDRFIRAIHGLSSMNEVNWEKKKDVYKRWGWSDDQILKAFRKIPGCMTASEEKIMAVMNFLVNEMGYDSSIVAENPRVIRCSLKERIIPRCSVIRILVSKGLIQENIPLSSLSVNVDNYFLDRFVKKYEQEIPELMKVYRGQLNYQQLLHN